MAGRLQRTGFLRLGGSRLASDGLEAALGLRRMFPLLVLRGLSLLEIYFSRRLKQMGVLPWLRFMVSPWFDFGVACHLGGGDLQHKQSMQ